MRSPHAPTAPKSKSSSMAFGGLTNWLVPDKELGPGQRALVAAAGSGVGVVFGGLVWLFDRFHRALLRGGRIRRPQLDRRQRPLGIAQLAPHPTPGRRPSLYVSPPESHSVQGGAHSQRRVLHNGRRRFGMGALEPADLPGSPRRMAFDGGADPWERWSEAASRSYPADDLRSPARQLRSSARPGTGARRRSRAAAKAGS